MIDGHHDDIGPRRQPHNRNVHDNSSSRTITIMLEEKSESLYNKKIKKTQIENASSLNERKKILFFQDIMKSKHIKE